METSSAEVEVATSSDLVRSPKWKIIKDRLFNIELSCAIGSFSYGLHSLIVTNLYIAKACSINLNLPPDICDNINQHDEENNQVEKIVTQLQLYSTFLYSIPCILASMVIGSWSDRNGRKPILIIPMLGSIIAQVIYILNVYFSSARAEYLLFSNIYSLFGGYTTMIIGTYSYIGDTTSPSARTSRLSVMSVMMTGGFTSGNLLSPYFFRHFGYYGVFATSASLYTIYILYITFFIKESLVNSPTETPRPVTSSLKNLVTSAKDVIYSAVRPREGFQRCLIILLLATMLLLTAAGNEWNMSYLFTRKMFAWDERKYSQVSSLSMILSTLANLLLLPLLSYKLSVPDSVIGIMASLSCLADALVTALAQSGQIYIFARCLGILSSQASTVIRSLLSKTVSSAELGKVYSLLGCLENLIPLGMSPLTTELYNSSLDVYPGAIYALSAGILFIACICFVAIALLINKDQQFHVLDNQTEEES